MPAPVSGNMSYCDISRSAPARKEPIAPVRFSASSRSKMLASTFEMMLTWFGGDAAAMWAAIDEYRAHQEGRPAAGEAPRPGALH
jgi:hypothetical protein